MLFFFSCETMDFLVDEGGGEEYTLYEHMSECSYEEVL